METRGWTVRVSANAGARRYESCTYAMTLVFALVAVELNCPISEHHVRSRYLFGTYAMKARGRKLRFSKTQLLPRAVYKFIIE